MKFIETDGRTDVPHVFMLLSHMSFMVLITTNNPRVEVATQFCLDKSHR